MGPLTGGPRGPERPNIPIDGVHRVLIINLSASNDCFKYSCLRVINKKYRLPYPSDAKANIR